MSLVAKDGRLRAPQPRAPEAKSGGSIPLWWASDTDDRTGAPRNCSTEAEPQRQTTRSTGSTGALHYCYWRIAEARRLDVSLPPFLTSGRDPATAGSSWKGQCSDGSCRRILRGLRSDHPVSSHPTIGSGRVAMESRSRCAGWTNRCSSATTTHPSPAPGRRTLVHATKVADRDKSSPHERHTPDRRDQPRSATLGTLRILAPGTTRTWSAPPNSPPS